LHQIGGALLEIHPYIIILASGGGLTLLECHLLVSQTYEIRLFPIGCPIVVFGPPSVKEAVSL
jgi:hypothetical protein